MEHIKRKLPVFGLFALLVLLTYTIVLIPIAHAHPLAQGLTCDDWTQVLTVSVYPQLAAGMGWQYQPFTSNPKLFWYSRDFTGQAFCTNQEYPQYLGQSRSMGYMALLKCYPDSVDLSNFTDITSIQVRTLPATYMQDEYTQVDHLLEEILIPIDDQILFVLQTSDCAGGVTDSSKSNMGFVGEPRADIYQFADLFVSLLEDGGYMGGQPIVSSGEVDPPADGNPPAGTDSTTNVTSQSSTDPSQMDPTQVPGMLGAAALGALSGIGLATAGISLASRAAGRAAGGTAAIAGGTEIFSPATGLKVPASQAAREQQWMNQGYVYRDGNWYAPKGEYRAEGPSILTREAEAARLQVRQQNQQWLQEYHNRIQEGLKDDIRFKMDLYQRSREFYNRQEALANIGQEFSKATAYTALEVCTDFLVGKIPLGKATKITKFLVKEVIDQGVIVVENVSNYMLDGKTNFLQDEISHYLSMFTMNASGMKNINNPSMRQFLIQENITKGVEIKPQSVEKITDTKK